MPSDLLLFSSHSPVIFLFVSLHDKFSSETGLLLDKNMEITQRKQEFTGHVMYFSGGIEFPLYQASSDEEMEAGGQGVGLDDRGSRGGWVPEGVGVGVVVVHTLQPTHREYKQQS